MFLDVNLKIHMKIRRDTLNSISQKNSKTDRLKIAAVQQRNNVYR